MIKLLFWAALIVIAVLFLRGLYGALRGDDDKINAHYTTLNMEDDSPSCINARGENVAIRPWQHKDFAQRHPSGLIAADDERSIVYDYDTLSKTPAVYRDFVLRVVCARNAGLDAKAAECAAVKRMREEKRLTKDKIPLIAQRSSPVSSGADDQDDRAQNLSACFNAPK